MAGSQAPHNGYGNYIKHTATVRGHSLQLWGAHLSRFNTTTGSPTRPGDVLGYAGSTGCSTGVHLHFTVKVDGLYVDPLTLIP
jgi:murein DD-endopeptidase MepM/ murein hydrolase activator NlpD